MLTTGSKYQRGMDTAQVAKLVRADIKAAKKAGTLPASLETSVRISRFAGGSSLSITVTAAPVQIHASDYMAHHVRTKGHQHWEGERFTPQARALLAKLEAIGGEYNRTDRDSQADYHNTNFFLHVDFHGDLEREDREILSSYYAALPAPAPGAPAPTPGRHLRLVG